MQLIGDAFLHGEARWFGSTWMMLDSIQGRRGMASPMIMVDMDECITLMIYQDWPGKGLDHKIAQVLHNELCSQGVSLRARDRDRRLGLLPSALVSSKYLVTTYMSPSYLKHLQ